MNKKAQVIRDLQALQYQYNAFEDKAKFLGCIKHPELETIFYNDINRRGERHTSIAVDHHTRKDLFEERRKLFLKKNEQIPKDIIISGSVIVKNEKEDVEQAIVSMYQLCDEICVTDTGSSDGTLGLLKKYPKVRLEKKKFVPWSFAAARNYNFSKCQGKILFVLDGDEELRPNDLQTRESVIGADKEILSAAVLLFNADGIPVTRTKELRFFPKGSIEWAHKIHNRPILLDETCEVVGDTGIDLYHYPYRSKKKAAARSKRDNSFIRDIKKEDDTFWKYHMLAKLYLEERKVKLAAESAIKGFRLFKEMPFDVQRNNAPFLLLAVRSLLANMDMNIGSLLGRYNNLSGPDVDFTFYNHMFWEINGGFDDAANWVTEHLKFVEDFDEVPVGIYETIRFYDDVLLKNDLYEFWRSIVDFESFSINIGDIHE